MVCERAALLGEWSGVAMSPLVFYMPKCGSFCVGVSYDGVLGVGMIGLELGMKFILCYACQGAGARSCLHLRFR